MKTKDITALREKPVAELKPELAKRVKELTLAKIDRAVGKLANVRKPARLSDEIAVIKTIIKEKS